MEEIGEKEKDFNQIVQVANFLFSRNDELLNLQSSNEDSIQKLRFSAEESQIRI